MATNAEITRTFKPSSANYWKGTAFSAAIFVPLIAVQFVLQRDKVVLWVILITLVPLLLAGIALYFARARVFITPTQVGKQDLVRTKWIPKADFDRSLLLRAYSPPAEQPRTELFMFAADGRKLMRLFGRFWAEQDMLAIVEESGAKLAVVDEVMRPKDVVALEPRALNWAEAHPWAFAFLASGAILTLTVVIVVLVVGA